MACHMTGSEWSGDDWQRYCRHLLSLRYGVAYQPVPDRDRGDFGIEGFTSGGEVFQCYAAQDPLSPRDLYEKQRDKMTADLNKLERNINAIRQLTSPATIKCWVLLVPRCDTKDIIMHGSVKGDEFRAKALPGVDVDFFVRILTDDDFAPEKQQLTDAAATLLPAPPADATEEEARAWETDEPEATGTLRRKIANLPHVPSSDRESLRMELVKRHLHAADTEDQLRRTQPQMWERLDVEKKQREQTLAVEHLAGTSDEQRTITREVQEMRSLLESAFPSLGGGWANGLAWGIVADWLIRCPLDPIPQGVA